MTAPTNPSVPDAALLKRIKMLVDSGQSHNVMDEELLALVALVKRTAQERDAANRAWERVAKSLGVTAEAAVEIAEEAHKLRAERDELRATLSRLTDGGTAKRCPRCERWFVPNPARQNVSCCVAHGPNDCCHYSETEVPAPNAEPS